MDDLMSFVDKMLTRYGNSKWVFREMSDPSWKLESTH